MYRLIGADNWYAGIATHYCESDKMSEVESALLNVNNANEIEQVLNELCPKPKEEFSLSKHLDQIEESFSASSVEEIFSNLEKSKSEWAKETLEVNIPCKIGDIFVGQTPICVQFP